MSRIRGADTAPEWAIRRALHHLGARYRLHVRVLESRPDLVFPKLMVAVFIDGCMWHGCPEHYTAPRSNSAFWQAKLATNVDRDLLQTECLREAGWRVLRVWEHALTPDRVATTAALLWAAIQGDLNAEAAFQPGPRVRNVVFNETDAMSERWTLRDVDGEAETWTIVRERPRGRQRAALAGQRTRSGHGVKTRTSDGSESGNSGG